MGFALPVLAPPARPPELERTSPRSVRISLTDRCDMACLYCRPSHHEGFLPAQDRLDVAHWDTLVRGLVREGVHRVRITGGEPLLFHGIVEVVRRIRALGVTDLALTTNASRLSRLAVPLRDAGLHRINVSLDSLRAERFARITRGGQLAQVLAGIDAARAAGFQDLKTNTVVLAGENDDELEDLVRWAWARDITPRFIEVMGVGEGAHIWREKLVPAAAMRERLAHLLEARLPVADPDRGPAKYLPARATPRHRVGFITGSTDTYCQGCDRLRATSDGVLRACLATNDGVSVAEELRAGGGLDAVAEGLRAAWARKPDGRWKGCTEASAGEVSMRATGG